MVIFRQDQDNALTARIDALEIRIWKDSASITVFDDLPDAPPLYHCLINIPAQLNNIQPDRNFIAAYLRNMLRMSPRSTWDEPDDLKKWPQPATRRFIGEPWQYEMADEA